MTATTLCELKALNACVQGLLHACGFHTDPHRPAAACEWHSIRLHQAPHHWQQDQRGAARILHSDYHFMIVCQNTSSLGSSQWVWAADTAHDLCFMLGLIAGCTKSRASAHLFPHA